MYKTILVPLDESKRAEAILPHVKELAQFYQAEVIFLCVLNPVPIVPGVEGAFQGIDPITAEQQMKEAKSYLAALQGEFREKGLATRMIVTYGTVVPTILDFAKREGVDLIAIASHGRSGLPRVFYGSVAAGVLQGVDRPLLVIRSA